MKEFVITELKTPEHLGTDSNLNTSRYGDEGKSKITCSEYTCCDREPSTLHCRKSLFKLFTEKQ